VPLTISVRDVNTGRVAQLFSRVSDERTLELGSGLDLVSNLAASQGLGQVLSSLPPRVTSTLCVRVRVLERRRRLGFCDTYREGGGPFDDMSQAFTLIDAFKFGRLTPLDASVSLDVRRGVREGFVIAARAPRRVRRGRRIRVRLLVQLRRGDRVRMSFAMRVPRSTRSGRRVLTLRGIVPESLREGSDEELEVVLENTGEELDTEAPGPRSVDALAAQLSALGRPDGLRATFSRRGRGRVVLPSDRILLRGRISVPVRVLRGRRR
nr:hypothetical protein [Actinomycetota bacterium]